MKQGARGPIPTIEQAIKELGPELERPTNETSEWPRYVVGSPETVRATLNQITIVLGVEELMVVTVVHGHAARMCSYELLANAFELTPR